MVASDARPTGETRRWRPGIGATGGASAVGMPWGSERGGRKGENHGEKHAKIMRKSWKGENHGEKHAKIMRKIIGKTWNHHGKSWEHHGTIMGKPW